MRALSEHQLAIVVRVAAGYSNADVALALHLSPHTVGSYLSAAMARLGVPNRAALVARCYTLGILDPGQWPPQFVRVSAPVEQS
jgi:DNA-binding NarL/FixJ family response regulator